MRLLLQGAGVHHGALPALRRRTGLVELPARARPARPPTGWLIPRPPALLDVHPADRPRDHQLLDLGGALEDVVDLGVAGPGVDRVLARVAVAAEDLDRTLGDPHGHLARLELAHRPL